MDTVAVIGTGLIGRAWAIVFARAGFAVRLWDPDQGAVAAAQAFVAARLPVLYQRPVSMTLCGGYPEDAICDSMSTDIDSRGW